MEHLKALVAGATGIVGRRIVDHLAETDGWTVIGMSRRVPENGTADFITADLSDAESCRQALAALEGITHVLYAARHDFAGHGPEPVDANTQMLRNVVQAVEEGGHDLRHVHIVQGTKYYGSNLGPFKTPALEDDPRAPVANFYFDQEDFLIERSATAGWSWSASRPHGMLDAGTGFARSMTQLIAVYAAIRKELGEPLYFPGTQGNYDALYQCTDTTQLARAVAWMAREPRCANQAFNVINGNYVRWRELWPIFADYFGMEPGPVRTVTLAEDMADKGPVWDRVVERHGLRPTPFTEAALWAYGDHLFTPHWDMVSSFDKARRYGFTAAPDTRASFLAAFDALRRIKVVP